MSKETLSSGVGPWRVGRSLGRTLYCNDKFVGIFDDPAIAAFLARKLNEDWSGVPEPVPPTLEARVADIEEHLDETTGYAPLLSSRNGSEGG